MRLRSIFAFATLVVCGLSAFPVLAQSNVNENEAMTLYVNAADGSDSYPGTSTQPFATVQAGVNAALVHNRKGIGVKVMVEPGIYRESVNIIESSTSTSAAITLQSATPGAAVIDGADAVTNWAEMGDGIYTFPWDDSVTGCTLPANWYIGMPPVVLANEMVFANGTRMNQVMSAGQLQPGTFYVDASNHEVDLDPPAGLDMNAVLLEVAARRSTLTIKNASNLVVRGFTLQHGASCMNTTAATVNSSTNILFDSNVVQWNNWSGLGFNSSSDFTVQNTVANNNGGAGLAGYKLLQGLWQNNETDFNNWRGAMVGLYDFGQGGTKLMLVHGGSVIGQASFNNQAQGLWFDTDNQNILIDNAVLAGNLVGNMQIELNQGPVTVTNSKFCSGGGVQVLETAGLSMSGNYFYGNGGTSFQNAQLFIGGKTGGRVVTDWQTGVTTNQFTTNTTFNSNTVVGADSSQYVMNTYLDSADWAKFASSLQSDSNDWYVDSNPRAFGVPGGKALNILGWQNRTGQDLNSIWSDPGTNGAGCAITMPFLADFQLQAHNSASYRAGYQMSKGAVAIPLQVRSFNSGPVTLSVSGLPTGVSGSFSAPSLISGSTTLTLTAAPSTPSQQALITIAATDGSQVHSISLWVSVSTPYVGSSTTLQAQANNVVQGTPVPVFVTVLGTSGQATPTGTVNIEVNGNSAAVLNLSKGSVQYSAVGLPVGTNVIQAIYSGDTVYAASTSPSLAVTVYPASTSTPSFAPAGGSYDAPQTVSISDPDPGAVVYYTTDGSTPSASSAVFSGPLLVNVTETFQAIAIATNETASQTASATYLIPKGDKPIHFGSGFGSGAGMQLNGSAGLVNGTLELTNGKMFEASSAFYSSPVAVEAFSTSFSLQLNQGSANGMTFVIQNDPLGAQALGPANSALGYSYGVDRKPQIAQSVAIKFDLYTSVGAGHDSTGLYLDGAHPRLPALDMTSSGVDLASGDPFLVSIGYDGVTLTMTILDAATGASYSNDWMVNIPSIVGANNAYVGFTASTGGLTATQQVLNWTFTPLR